MDELRFLIRKERKGEVSNYLHRLPNNAEIDVRGLYPEYVLPEDIQSVAFLVGGTGIAPAMQAADILAGQADIHILWSSRRREDCIGGYNDTKPASQRWSFWPRSTPVQNSSDAADLQGVEKGALVSMLERLKTNSVSEDEQRSRLSVDYFIDDEGSFANPEDVKRMLSSLSKGDQSGRKILIVSGPEGFVGHWAGSKQWSDGREVQGPLRGILSTLDLEGWEVVKL
ncbi:uncharacterized protein MYCFIDRAFT_161636 [Pseudocercospora fijiensis CIRAD86]|uniref:Ferric reductase NAD binding domain-containing protein n=1 Tax=Pseudocercospora fijiensis (strain CIRAD86) TaxID=383855 RepID=M3B9P4_PSEFD|nr:uncharacterized protein MYCFIDRAFT_161636 [Pseudocercospora fijiensis CIRAD86]EME86047.1 hypothetical protein MYCFIDRAFT_161636 [Pseudocercospora fijiensis CIRAD86]